MKKTRKVNRAHTSKKIRIIANMQKPKLVEPINVLPLVGIALAIYILIYSILLQSEAYQMFNIISIVGYFAAVLLIYSSKKMLKQNCC